MNKTHRIVWSAARQAYIVAHEHATACGKPASTRAAAVLVAGLLAAAPALAASACDGNGSGNYVVAGDTTVSCMVTSSALGEMVNITVDKDITIDVRASGDSAIHVLSKVTDVDANNVPIQPVVNVGSITNNGTLISGKSNIDVYAGIKVSGNVAVSGDIIHSGTINTVTPPEDERERYGIVVTSSCRVPCDYVPARSWPLFKARDVLQGIIQTLTAKQPSDIA